MFNFILACAFGACMAFFLDPDQGRRRRAMARDRGGRVLRRGMRRTLGLARYTGGKAFGLTQEAIHVRPADVPRMRNLIHFPRRGERAA